MNRNLIGLGLLALVALLAVAITQFGGRLMRPDDTRQPVSLSILYGGEKTALLGDADVRRILADRYRITLDAVKAGSIEMAVSRDVTGRDCLWPSNMVAVELARQSGRNVLGDQTILNSPIVFFAWAPVAEALAARGLVREQDGFLTADIQAIAAEIERGARWKEDFGLNVYGPFRIASTDPSKSNSGNIWAGLLATAMNDGAPPTPAQVESLLPRVAGYFAAAGYMETSSGDLFDTFLKQGMGARPMIVGYENQLVEFTQMNAANAQMIRDRIRVIYPQPTVFASHPLISLTPMCKRLVEALTDPEVQALAWEHHGFRTGLIGVANDPAKLTAAKLPETVDLIVPMPPAATMQRIIQAVE